MKSFLSGSKKEQQQQEENAKKLQRSISFNNKQKEQANRFRKGSVDDKTSTAVGKGSAKEDNKKSKKKDTEKAKKEGRKEKKEREKATKKKEKKDRKRSSSKNRKDRAVDKQSEAKEEVKPELPSDGPGTDLETRKKYFKENGLKICLAGLQIGKSALILRLKTGEFSEECDATIQDFHEHELEVDGETYKLSIMDTAGDLMYTEFYPQWFSWADGFMALYSIADAGSFDAVTDFRDHFLSVKKAESVPLLLVGTQLDEDAGEGGDSARQVLTSEGQRLTFTWGCPLIEVSSKTGENVVEAFRLMVREILNFGVAKETKKLSRLEREALWQEKQKQLKLEKERTDSEIEEAQLSSWDSTSTSSSNSIVMKSALSPPLTPRSGERDGPVPDSPTSSTRVPLVGKREGYIIEKAQSRTLNPVYHFKEKNVEGKAYALDKENLEHNNTYYKDYFWRQPHQNYCGIIPEMGPVIISITKLSGLPSEPSQRRVRHGTARKAKECWGVLFRSKESVEMRTFTKKDFRGSNPNKKLIFSRLDKRITPELMKLVRDPKLGEELLEFEDSCTIHNYKFGILYCKGGQTTEEEMFGNEHGSRAFSKFLSTIGDKIFLQGWDGYAAGLDVNNNKTGKYSLVAKWENLNIHFHVSTFLPYTSHNEQQLERKRHIGNDVCCIVFQDGPTTFFPDCISSEFLHVFMVVREEKVPPESRQACELPTSTETTPSQSPLIDTKRKTEQQKQEEQRKTSEAKFQAKQQLIEDLENKKDKRKSKLLNIHSKGLMDKQRPASDSEKDSPTAAARYNRVINPERGKEIFRKGSRSETHLKTSSVVRGESSSSKTPTPSRSLAISDSQLQERLLKENCLRKGSLDSTGASDSGEDKGRTRIGSFLFPRNQRSQSNPPHLVVSKAIAKFEEEPQELAEGCELLYADGDSASEEVPSPRRESDEASTETGNEDDDFDDDDDVETDEKNEFDDDDLNELEKEHRSAFAHLRSDALATDLRGEQRAVGVVRERRGSDTSSSSLMVSEDELAARRQSRMEIDSMLAAEEHWPCESSSAHPTYYRVMVTTKEDVPPSSPHLPNPPVFEASEDFREMILAKLVNAENSSYKAAAFVKKMQRTREVVFTRLVNTYAK
ncbi:putative Rap/Ran GTPase-activating protein [Balamuthia mandrillaris]